MVSWSQLEILSRWMISSIKQSCVCVYVRLSPWLPNNNIKSEVNYVCHITTLGL
uniref:Uncharacterized protein n=1 Tax=Octopus bimaculoides TaxID=37653 RepID=A0A0L8FWW5_OCTBM